MPCCQVCQVPRGIQPDLTGLSGVRTLDNVIKTDRINFRLGPDLRNVLQAYVQRYDRTEADTIREAVWLFLETKGYGRPRRKGAKKR